MIQVSNWWKELSDDQQEPSHDIQAGDDAADSALMQDNPPAALPLALSLATSSQPSVSHDLTHPNPPVSLGVGSAVATPNPTLEELEEELEVIRMTVGMYDGSHLFLCYRNS